MQGSKVTSYKEGEGESSFIYPSLTTATVKVTKYIVDHSSQEFSVMMMMIM